MAMRATLGAASRAALAALAVAVWAAPADAAAVVQAQPAAQVAPDASDDDLTIKAFLQRLEQIVLAGDAEAFAALEGPLGDAQDALAFARAEIRSGATRVVVQERDRTELSLSGIPGGGYGLTLDAFIESGNQARVATWQLFIRRSGDTWGIIRQQIVSSVDNLFRLTLDASKQFDVRNLAITAEDLTLTITEGTAFAVDTDLGITGLVITGRGDMRFAPAPETERGQVRIFTGAEVLETRFDAAFIRVGTVSDHFKADDLVARASVDSRDLKRAQQIFREESPKSFAVDLADLTRDAWTLLPGQDDFLAEIRTRRFNTLTYARSASEPEDISVFERRRHKNISIYPSKEKLASRGRFYNEDDLAGFDVLDYDIDVTSIPERAWIEGRARMRIKVRTPSLGQLTIKLADSLVVRSITSDRFGRMFNLRVTNQNTILVNLPATLPQNEELLLTVVYSGRLQPQTPDRETLLAAQDQPPPFSEGPPPQMPDDMSLPLAEPSYLYSNRSYWYPQSTVTDFATARIHLSVPVLYGCVATGEPIGKPEIIVPKANPQDARRSCEFRANSPARYLSFIVSRFIESDRRRVMFDAGMSTATDGGDRPASAARAGSGIDLIVQSNPRQTRKGRDLAPRAADILQFYQSVVGDAPYPSFTVAYVENALPGGHSPAYFAQLNAPLPNTGLSWRNDPAAFDNYPEFFMAHEVAHQWWGQGVAWQNYHEQWLSEGFAQYFAALYAKKFRGDDVFQGVLRRMRRWAIDQSGQGPVYLGYRIGHIKNDGRAFRAVIYNKGAMVLHMLRLLVGDDVFFRGMRRFYTDSRFRKVGTEDFRAAMEAESGRDLGRFFERWIYNATLPQIAFSYRVEPTGSGQAAVLRFEQTGDIFDVPATVTLEYADGRTREVQVALNDRVVEFPAPLDGPLKSASISKKDVGLVEYR